MGQRVIFWCSVILSIGAIACGYSTIRSSRVKTEKQLAVVEQRLDKLEKLVDLHVQQQSSRALPSMSR